MREASGDWEEKKQTVVDRYLESAPDVLLTNAANPYTYHLSD